MKKTLLFVVGQLSVVAVAVALVANAQTAAGGGSASGGVSVGEPAIIVSSTPIPPPNSGFIQFNNLTVQSVSSQTVPAEIDATASGPIPMLGAAAANGSVPQPASPSSPSANCFAFQSESDNNGTAVACPTPAQPSAPTPAIYPYQTSYRIEIGASTELMLRDRTAATLSSFSVGDQINVFGYYNTDGSVQAYLVRDVSKPIVTQTIQLNSVNLISVSGTSVPATLAVTQNESSPCYSFSTDGTEAPYACPMGISSFSQNPATENMMPPTSMEPSDIALRKYVVNVDAQTIILDRNRTQLSLANLNTGDQLNVYGETSDNGQTVTADIIRDLSIPATPETYGGKVTQVNADGSFILQTVNGQTITVPNPIQVGATVSATGILNTGSNMLSSVTQVNFTNGFVLPGPPLPIPLPLPQPNVSTPGGPCGGNTAQPYVCPAGYSCTPNPSSTLPFGDVGGTCQPSQGQPMTGCSMVNGHQVCF